MNTFKQFKKGECLVRQGKPSDCVFLIRSGEIEILREVGTSSVVLGKVRRGEWLGEMGVIEGRKRSSTARASEDGEAEVLTVHQFLDRVSKEPVLARDLILRLSMRLRGVEDKFAEELRGVPDERTLEGINQPAPQPASVVDDIGLTLTAQSDALRARISDTPIHITKLPFLTGRVPAEDETPPSRPPDLLIEDELPYRLSRQHFTIARSGGGFLVSDLGSTLGTIVNDQAIGQHFAKDSAPLNKGENHIVAGGWDSPYIFLVTVN